MLGTVRQSENINSIVIPLEQGLRPPASDLLMPDTHSIVIPLEQGLRHVLVILISALSILLSFH